MKEISRKDIKTLIELSTSFEEADEVLRNYTDFQSDIERIAYLRGLFDCKIVGRSEENIHTDYVAILTAIVDKKWRGQ